MPAGSRKDPQRYQWVPSLKLTLIIVKETSQFKTVCKDNRGYNYRTTKTAEIKKVIN